MSACETPFPAKARDIRNATFDSTLWDDFDFRDGDVVIDTWSKSGTTWAQQIIAQLIFGGREGIALAEVSPWYDCVLAPHDEIAERVRAQRHRRFLKTHLPADALVISPRAKYVYIGRDGRDAVWSLHNHHLTFAPDVFEAINASPLLAGGARFEPANPDVVEYFREWLARDGYPWWPFWDHIRSWWNMRWLPNVLLLHFTEMTIDMPRQIRRIAGFLGIAIEEHNWPAIVEHCGFDYMKAHAETLAPFGGALWNGGATTFMHKGTNGRWRDHLSSHDVRAYEERAREELGDECAYWLATGERR